MATLEELMSLRLGRRLRYDSAINILERLTVPINFCVNIELSLPVDLSTSLSMLGSSIHNKYPTVTYYIGDSNIPPHITLHYVYLPEQQLQSLVGLIDKVVSDHSAPDLKLEKIDAAPS